MGSRSKLFLTTAFALYLELIAIRWLGSEIRIFSFLKNIPLIVSFLGLGLGVMAAYPRFDLRRWIPWTLFVFVSVLALAPIIGLSSLPIPSGDDVWIWGSSGKYLAPILQSQTLSFALAVLLFAVVITFFTLLLFVLFFGIGQIIRERFLPFRPLQAYSLDLLGSMTGVALFGVVSFLQLSPFWWFFIAIAMYFVAFPCRKSTLTLFVAALGLVYVGTMDTRWSPYYRVEVQQITEENTNEVSTVVLDVNHSFFQHMGNHNEEFLSRNPDSLLSKTAFDYNLPYRFVTRPGDVLVVGAGTGNDVAAALRAGATHVDAVEIDPVILELGSEMHPEDPYHDPRVTLINDDARSYFEKTDRRYDTVVYGLLDSHTSVSAFSNVRLDNFVYTLESFEAAKTHLQDDGSLIFSFGTGKSWIHERLSSMLSRVFGQQPFVFKRLIGGDGGIFVLGNNLDLDALGDPTVSSQVLNIPGNTSNVVPTDDWPYLYLESRKIPTLYLGTLGLILVIFVFVVWKLLGAKTFTIFRSRDGNVWHFFFLGAAFLLIETKSINEIALLFGSTWVVNLSVILGILFMAFLANSLLRTRLRIPRWLVIAGLFGSLVLMYLVRVSSFSGASFGMKFVLAGLFIALPLFFSGLLFSQSLKHANNMPEAFGANLFGAFAGGLLENTALIIGIHALVFVAAALYFTAVILSPRTRESS